MKEEYEEFLILAQTAKVRAETVRILIECGFPKELALKYAGVV